MFCACRAVATHLTRVAFSGGLALVAMAGCTASPTAKETTTLRRQVDVMRSRGADDGRTIRRLEDRIFLLEDQLETARLQHRGAPQDPLDPPVRTSEPPAPAAELERESAPPRGQVVADVFDGGLAPEPGVQVIYEGEALDPKTRRIVLGDDRMGSIEPASDPGVAPGKSSRRRRAGAPTAGPELASGRGRGLPDPGAVTDRISTGVSTGGVSPLPGASSRAAARAAPVAGSGGGDAGPERAYRAAVDALKGHEHAAAIAGLRSFLQRWPAHDFADNAQYWLGEAFYDQRDYKVALGEFKKVIAKYPRGNKAPDAMLKVGLTHLGLGDPGAARSALKEVVSTYPTSDAARLAESRLAEIK